MYNDDEDEPPVRAIRIGPKLAASQDEEERTEPEPTVMASPLDLAEARAGAPRPVAPKAAPAKAAAPRGPDERVYHQDGRSAVTSLRVTVDGSTIMLSQVRGCEVISRRRYGAGMWGAGVVMFGLGFLLSSFAMSLNNNDRELVSIVAGPLVAFGAIAVLILFGSLFFPLAGVAVFTDRSTPIGKPGSREWAQRVTGAITSALADRERAR